MITKITNTAAVIAAALAADALEVAGWRAAATKGGGGAIVPATWLESVEVVALSYNEHLTGTAPGFHGECFLWNSGLGGSPHAAWLAWHAARADWSPEDWIQDEWTRDADDLDRRQDHHPTLVFARVSVGNDGHGEGRHDGGEHPSFRAARDAAGVQLPVHWAREEIWAREREGDA